MARYKREGQTKGRPLGGGAKAGCYQGAWPDGKEGGTEGRGHAREWAGLPAYLCTAGLRRRRDGGSRLPSGSELRGRRKG